MSSEKDDIIFPALGRTVFLGQLYNASSERFINAQLFDNATRDKTQTLPNAFTSVKFKDIDNISQRMDALDINAELSVGIMGGMIELKGSGSYLDTSKTNVATREVSLICTTSSRVVRLDGDPKATKTSYDSAVERGATHVVTAIKYGGTLVTNITEKKSSSDTQTKIQGEFSASIMKNMASKFSAEGKASIDSDKTAQDVAQNRDFLFYADYASASQGNPTSIGEIFELVKKWPELVGEGVPCEITVSPVSVYTDGSVETKILHQLESSDLNAVLDVYNDLFLLGARRDRICTILEAGLAQFYPTFSRSCRSQKSVVDGIMGNARKALAKYLVEYRNGGLEKAGETQNFLENVGKGYRHLLKECEDNESLLGLFSTIKNLAASRQTPLTTIGDLRDLMTQATHGMLGVVLIPSSPKLDGCINTYDVLVSNIRRWRDDEDKKDVDTQGNPKKTVFYSLYCDPQINGAIINLDGKKGALRKALTASAKSSDPCFVHYGELPWAGNEKNYDWSLLNEEGWAFQSDERDSSFYMGQVSNGKRHGRGKITYADGSTYSGDWWEGMRHGQGEIVDKQKTISGIFIEDQYRADGIVVELKKMDPNSHSLIKPYKIPLRMHDGMVSHVLQIATMLKWKMDEEHKMVAMSSAADIQPIVVSVIGQLLKPGQEQFANATLPFDKGEVVIEVERR